MAKRGRPPKKKKEESSLKEKMVKEEETKEKGDSIFDDGDESKILTTEKVFGENKPEKETKPKEEKKTTSKQKLTKPEKTEIYNYLEGIKNLAFRNRTSFSVGDCDKIKSHCNHIDSFNSEDISKDDVQKIRSLAELCRKHNKEDNMMDIINYVEILEGRL